MIISNSKKVFIFIYFHTCISVIFSLLLKLNHSAPHPFCQITSSASELRSNAPWASQLPAGPRLVLPSPAQCPSRSPRSSLRRLWWRSHLPGSRGSRRIKRLSSRHRRPDKSVISRAHRQRLRRHRRVSHQPMRQHRASLLQVVSSRRSPCDLRHQRPCSPCADHSSTAQGIAVPVQKQGIMPQLTS